MDTSFPQKVAPKALYINRRIEHINPLVHKLSEGKTAYCQQSHWITNKVIAWLMLPPFFFLAGYGQFFFLGTRSNDALSYGRSNLVAGAQSSLVNIVSAVMLICIALLILTRRRAVQRALLENRTFVALIIACILSTAWSQFPTLTIRAMAPFVASTLFAFYIAQRFRAEEQLRLMYFFGWITILLSLVLAVFFPGIGIDQHEGAGAWEGIFYHKNIAAIVMSYLLCVGLSMECKGYISNILNKTYLALSLVFIFMTQSRSGWIMVAALLLYMVSIQLLVRFQLRDRALILLAMLLCVSILSALAVGYLPALLGFAGKDTSLTGRTDLWPAVMHSIMKHPYIGYGYGGFWNGLSGESGNLSMSLGGWIPAHAQSGFLDVWLQIGGVGLGLILLTFIIAVRDGMECMRMGPDYIAQWYLGMVLITFISNTDERSLMFPVCLEWVLYVLACVGLADRAKKYKAQMTAHAIAIRSTSGQSSGLSNNGVSQAELNAYPK